MPERLADRIIDVIDATRGPSDCLILLVAPSGGGKTPALRITAERIGAALINVNLELSIRMRDLTEDERPLRTLDLLRELVNEAPSDIVLLDNIELLFDVSLKQDPLPLLQRLARNRTLVVAWSGSIVEGRLVYAKPGHPEYRRYPITGLVIVGPETGH